MNDELAGLPEAVREAVEKNDIAAPYMPLHEWPTIRAELLRLARENVELREMLTESVHTNEANATHAAHAEAELAAMKRWAQEARGYLTAASESSMSRNNSEELAGELLDDLVALLPVGGE